MLYVNCDYSDKIGIVEKVLVLIYILGILPNSHLELKTSFSNMLMFNAIINTYKLELLRTCMYVTLKRQQDFLTGNKK
jgi:hypothetical protein